MAFGVLDPAARRLEYVRAGHNPVVWRRPAVGRDALSGRNGHRARHCGSGALRQDAGDRKRWTLNPVTLVFYSDGLTEAMNEGWSSLAKSGWRPRWNGRTGWRPAARDSILEEVSRFLEGGHCAGRSHDCRPSGRCDRTGIIQDRAKEKTREWRLHSAYKGKQRAT